MASAVVRRSASSSIVAYSCSAAEMSARRRAETCASISVTELDMSDQLVATAALKGVGRDAHVSWGAKSMGSAGLDGACRCTGSHCCCRRCYCHSYACSPAPGASVAAHGRTQTPPSAVPGGAKSPPAVVHRGGRTPAAAVHSRMMIHLAALGRSQLPA